MKKNKGKILKIKQGYNPNSSSIGSGIPTYLFFLLGSGAATMIILNMMNTFDKFIKKTKKLNEPIKK